MTHAIDHITLVAYFTGSLNDFEKRRVGLHVESCPACRESLRTMQIEKETFLSGHPFSALRPLPRKLSFKPVYALAASLILCFGAWYSYQTNHPGYRLKGDTRLTLFVKAQDGAVSVREQPVYRPGEKIQFTYSCGENNQFILLSIDERGSISRYYPQTGDSSIALEIGRDLPLPNSIVLDDYIGDERYIAYFSKTRLYVPAVEAALAAAFNTVDSLKYLVAPAEPDADVKMVALIKKRSVP
jgi:hypothetical protein